MRRAALLAAAGLAAAAPLAAQERPAPQQQQPRVHVVQRGETLWDIARAYLSDPFLWPEIFRLNTDVVEDPARIYPSERLVLPPGVGGAPAAQEGPEGRTVFYRGEQVQRQDMRIVAPLGTTEFPVVRQGDFYRASFVARQNEVRPAGRVAEVVSPTVVPIARQPMIRLYDKVYVKMEPGAQARIGDRMQFIRPGREVRPHGNVYEPMGIATVAALEDGVATVVVVRLFDVVEPGHWVVPVERFPIRAGARPERAQGPQGTILTFGEPHPVQSPGEIAILDLGRQAGVREGDEFEVYMPRTERDWGTRPEIPVARLQVVKVTEGTASARITSIDQPAVAVGLPVRRVARMPETR